MKVSVIVPGYNCENTVRKCLDSLIFQTLDDIEIIFINDGSTDGTKKIAEEYAEKYKNIKLVNVKNGGQSKARNIGLDMANGDYIAFLDSDDYIEPTMLEKMYSKAISSGYDMVLCDVNIVYPDKNLIISSGLNLDTTDSKIIRKSLVYSYSAGVVWNKIYKKELLKNLRFKEGVWYEDVHFNFKLFPTVKSVGVVTEPLINYVQTEGSITYTYNEKLYDIINNFNDLIVYYKSNDLYDSYYDELEYSYIRYAYNTFVKRLAKCGSFSKFMKGVKYAKSEVKKHFPKYRKNKYLKPRDIKSLMNYVYFIAFNNLFASFIYVINIGKMN